MQLKSPHELLGEYELDTEDKIDQVAERIRVLGYLSLGILKQFAKLTRLQEYEDEENIAKTAFKNLIHDREVIISNLRNDLNSAMEKTGMPEQAIS